MKNSKNFLEINGFYFGVITGAIVYLILVLKIFFILSLNWDMGLVDIIEMALVCIIGLWLFLPLSAKIGQIIGLLLWKYVNRVNMTHTMEISSLPTTTKASNITYSNIINLPERRRLNATRSKSLCNKSIKKRRNYL